MVTEPTPRDPALLAAGSPWERDSFSDGDGYAFGLPLVEGELHRADATDGSVDMAIRDYDRMLLSTVHVGFGVVGRVAPTSGAICLGLVLEAPPGSRWDGRDLVAGDVMLYPPMALNTSVEGPGLRYGVISIELELVLEAIEELGRHARELHRGPMREELARDVTRAFSRATLQDDPEAVAAAVASALSTSPVTRQPPRRIMSSERITQRAIDYVHSTGDWTPSSLALCRAARVSERRLQLAFAEMYGMTPSGVFRLRALSMARRRLQRTEETKVPITSIATDLGFYHLSRFSADYKSVFGEKPSDTLANRRVRRLA